MKKSILFSTFLILGISCSNQFLEEDTNNTPQENFNILWEDFDKHYGLFSVRNHNWDSIYNAHSSLISSQTSDEELWDNFKEIIEYLDDSHVFIYDPFNDIEFYSGSEEDDQVEEEFSLSLIKNSYLEYHENILPNVLIGKLKNKNIGYLYLNDFEIENTNFMN